MKLKMFIVSLCMAAGAGTVNAQATASAISGGSLIPMALVMSAGVQGGSTTQEASALGMLVPLALSIAGAELVVDTAVSTSKGISYGLRRVSDGATVGIEVLSKVASQASLAVGATLTVVAVSGGIVLFASDRAIAFVPNQVGKSLMHNQLVK